MDRISDVEVARMLSNSLSGRVYEWPQLKPLLRRLADRIEALEGRRVPEVGGGPRRCPFCGSRDLYLDEMVSEQLKYHFVVCRECWSEGPMCATIGPTVQGPEALAVSAWNGDLLPVD